MVGPGGTSVRYVRRRMPVIPSQILLGRVTGLRVPRRYLALTIYLLPERLRGEFGSIFGDPDQCSVNLALARIRLWIGRPMME